MTLALACALWGSLLPAQAEPRLTLTSNVVWDIDAPWFGGFSGLEVAADGATLSLLTDRARFVTARLSRTDGRIDRIQLLSQQPLRSANGAPLQGAIRDAEGLAISRSGTAFASFEFRHRVTQLNPETGITTRLPPHEDFAGFELNTGLEALALHPDGRLFALSEKGADASGTIPLYAYRNGAWQIADRLPPSGTFLPVGADIDDQGRLYLLERTVSLLGFRSQIRRFDLSQSPVPAQTLLTSPPGTFDNLEALSVWQDANGKTRLTLISDDNFRSFQTTQIVEYLLTE